MSSVVQTTAPAKELGFSYKQGVNWFEYLDFRPVYPPSFFEHVYSYHAEKPSASWFVAHDIGAGCGVVSAGLASKFPSVIVSDPNDGFVTLAQSLLEKVSASASTSFQFFQEGAEKSSVASRAVDVAIAAECIQWTDTTVAIREIGRELKVGGTSIITHYTVPRIVGNDKAQKVWKAIWDEYSKRATGPLLDHAVSIVNTALDCLEFPEDEWERVKRVHVNAQGRLESYQQTLEVRRVMSRSPRRWCGWRATTTGRTSRDWHGSRDTSRLGCQWFLITRSSTSGVTWRRH
jgi:ubiquinone/menaquinone biosynthesis C-methylase UbiE